MEGFLLSVRPILIGLPLLIIVCAAQCYIEGVSVVEFLYAFPVWVLSDSLTCRKTICPLYLITAFDLYRIVLDRCHNDIIPDFLRCQHINRIDYKHRQIGESGSREDF